MRFLKIAGFCLLLLTSPRVFCQNYCVPVFTNNYSYIDDFAFHTLVNLYSGVDSDCYVLYPDSLFTTQLNIGETYPLNVSSTWGGKFAAWIDYNDDSVFDSSELILNDTLNTGNAYELITIPYDTSFIGQRRLRIMCTSSTTSITPCGSYAWGEAEDYMLTIGVNQPHTQSYCMPFSAYNFDNFNIDDFQMGNIINNNSGSNSINYVLYPQALFTTTLYTGVTWHSIYISKGITAGNTGGYAMWIDLDNDGDFSASELLYIDGPGLTSSAGAFLLPAVQSYGPRRMRVRSLWAAIPSDPCDLLRAGETEDYTIEILPGNPAATLDLVDMPELMLYPSPSTGEINVLCSEMIEEIVITNSLGQAVYHANPGQAKMSCHLENNGVYFASITAGQHTMVKKFVVVH